MKRGHAAGRLRAADALRLRRLRLCRTTPSFSTQALSLVDRGWIWASAHVRGGSDKGWGWFLDGRGLQEDATPSPTSSPAPSTWSPRATATPGRIAAYGGSAGGMLVGAVANMRPDLWGAIIAAVPFVDVLNTMSDATLPLTPPEWPEWGNPLEDPAAYDYIASYSPYDNVAAQPYPADPGHAAGLSDPRVTWWEPEKWVARLREHTTSGRPDPARRSTWTPATAAPRAASTSSRRSPWTTPSPSGRSRARRRFDHPAASADRTLEAVAAIYGHHVAARPGHLRGDRRRRETEMAGRAAGCP